jgi:hypothetical protein
MGGEVTLRRREIPEKVVSTGSAVLTHPQDTTQPPPPAEQPTENTAWSDAPLEESDSDESDRSAR